MDLVTLFALQASANKPKSCKSLGGCNYQFALRASANDPKRSQSFQIANFSNLSTPFALQASANWPKTCKCLWDWFSRVCTASQCKQPKKVDLVTPFALQANANTPKSCKSLDFCYYQFALRANANEPEKPKSFPIAVVDSLPGDDDRSSFLANNEPFNQLVFSIAVQHGQLQHICDEMCL